MKTKTRAVKIRKQYFDWLFDLINRRDTATAYKDLAAFLFEKEFVVIVPNDKNRAADGIKLRECFCDSKYLPEDDEHLLEGPCTILEMLIGLSQRMEFTLSSLDDDEILTAKWFWFLIRNLGFEIFSKDDPEYNRKYDFNNLVVKKFVERTYGPDGRGGLFPLKNPQDDQRQVEIWYQMHSYIRENNL